jgi:hypothetical protein
MARDRIVEEVRAIRAALAKEHGYDLKAYVRSLERDQARSGRKLVTLPPRRLARKPLKRKTG